MASSKPSNKTISPPISSSEDVDPILMPLPGKFPVGISLRYKEVYDKIREARREEDPSLPQGIWQRPIKRANFKEVEALCVKALTTQSKDFQIMAWLIEAWFELYKISGLLKGLDICLGLCTRFWEDGFPSIQDEDVEYRVAPFHWLNEKFSPKLFSIYFTEPSSGITKEYTYRNWKDALERDRLFQKTQNQQNQDDAEMQGRPSLKSIQDAIDQTSFQFFNSLKSSLSVIILKVEAIEEFLLQKAPLADISLYQLKKTLKEIQNTITQILAQKSGSNINSSEEPEIQTPQPLTGSLEEDFLGSPKPLSFEEDPISLFSNQMSLNSSPEESTLPLKSDMLPAIDLKTLKLSSHEQAYILLKISMEFLMKTEPHSPAPYLIRRAISWGNKTLEDVFQEILEETGDLNQILSLLGMRPKNTDSTS